MDKYKAIAEKITYSLDGYIADHNNRNFGDADLWLRHVRNRWEQFIEAHPDSHNFHEYLQHQQAKVEELQKRVENALKLISEKAEDIDLSEYRISGRFVDANELEQALKGEG